MNTAILLLEGWSPPSSGLYFQLNNTLYFPGDTVFINNIGNENYYNRSDPMLSLVCVTSNVNRNCCRWSDGERVGEWYYPNGTMVQPSYYHTSLQRRVFAHQVRLIRFREVLEPLGNYTCVVPDYHGNLFNASIRIG